MGGNRMTRDEKVKGAGEGSLGGLAGHAGAVAREAKTISDVLTATRPRATDGGRAVGREAAKLRRNGPRSGDYRNAAGHAFERLDIATHNVGRLRGRLKPAASPSNPCFDAVRTVAGRVEHVDVKLSAKRAIAAARSTDKAEVFRVPNDQFARAAQGVGERATVEASRLSSAQTEQVMSRGLRRLASGGNAAASTARVAGKAGAAGAVIGVAVGAVAEMGSLRRGEISKAGFAKNRLADGIEGAAAGVVAVAAGATFVAVAGGTAAVFGVVVGGMAVAPIVVGAAAGVVTTVAVRKVVTSHLRTEPMAPQDPPAEPVRVFVGDPVSPNGSGTVSAMAA